MTTNFSINDLQKNERDKVERQIKQKGREKLIHKCYLPEAKVFMAGAGLCTVLEAALN